MDKNYFFILIHVIFSCLFSILIFGVSYIAILRIPTLEKLSSYECGFDPFDMSHTNFEVRYFLVALLFILFDLEVSILFPFATLVPFMDSFNFFIGLFYIFLLSLGFIYEWRKGALDFI